MHEQVSSFESNTNYFDNRSDDSDVLVLTLIHEPCYSFLLYDIYIYIYIL